jgi:hypothetical protein
MLLLSGIVGLDHLAGGDKTKHDVFPADCQTYAVPT